MSIALQREILGPQVKLLWQLTAGHVAGLESVLQSVLDAQGYLALGLQLLEKLSVVAQAAVDLQSMLRIGWQPWIVGQLGPVVVPGNALRL